MPLGGASEPYKVFLPAGWKRCSSSSASARHWEEGRSSLVDPQKLRLLLGDHGVQLSVVLTGWPRNTQCCATSGCAQNTWWWIHMCIPSAWHGSIWRQGKPGFSHQKMRNKFNKDVECINLQKTLLREAMTICSSKWAKTPKTLCSVVVSIMGGQICHKLLPSSTFLSGVPCPSLCLQKCRPFSAAQMKALRAAEHYYSCFLLHWLLSNIWHGGWIWLFESMLDPKEVSPALSALWAYLQFELTYISTRDKNVYFCHCPGEEVRSVYAACWCLEKFRNCAPLPTLPMVSRHLETWTP